MASWTSITAGRDWQAQSFVKQFAEAINERDDVLYGPGGGGGVTVPSAGDDIQAVNFWKNFQDWVDTHCNSFVRSYDGGSKLAGGQSGDYDNVASAPSNYDNLEDLLQRVHGVSISPLSFRRATTWPTNWTDIGDAAFSYGKITAGDIIGPWIFDDLQKALNGLRWTQEAFIEVDGELYQGASTDNDLATAKNEALNNFGYDSGVSDLYAATWWDYQSGGYGGDDYAANARRCAVKGDINGGLFNGCKRDIDWMCKTLSYAGSWESFGDHVYENKYSVLQTDSPAQNSTTPKSSNFLVDQTDKSGMDQWGSEDVDYGWKFGSGTYVALVRWDVTDGFDYIDDT